MGLGCGHIHSSTSRARRCERKRARKKLRQVGDKRPLPTQPPRYVDGPITRVWYF